MPGKRKFLIRDGMKAEQIMETPGNFTTVLDDDIGSKARQNAFLR